MISSKMAGHSHHLKAHNETVSGGWNTAAHLHRNRSAAEVYLPQKVQTLKCCASRSFLGAGREEHSCCSKAQRCPSYGLRILPGCISQTSTKLLASLCPISNGASHISGQLHDSFPNSGDTGPFLPIRPMRLILHISSMAAQRLSEHRPLCQHFTGVLKELP